MEIAPLSIVMELGDVKTGIPILENDRVAACVVDSIDQLKHEKGDGLRFKFKLTEECPVYGGGEPVKAGFPVSQNIWFFDKNTPPDEVPERSRQAVARFLDAIFGTGDPGNKKNKPPRPAFSAETVAKAIGMPVMLRFKAVPDGEYAGTEIKGAYFPPDMQA